VFMVVQKPFPAVDAVGVGGASAVPDAHDAAPQWEGGAL
jgi:hypothetical protein